jgi:hypothetical protein
MDAEKLSEVLDILDYVGYKHPECIRFNPDDYVVKNLQLLIGFDKFSTMLYTYGYLFVLAMKEYYLSIEAYEKCAEINKAIDEHNSLVNDLIPYSL